ATATDEAGNTSDPTTVTVDGTAPAAPVIVEATDDVGDITDPLASGDSTDDTTPTLIGTAEAESTIEVFQDGASIGTATADADGNWSFTPDALDDGEVTFTATATDAAGNTSAASGAFTVTVDTIAPDAPTLNVAANDDGTVTASGEAEAGSTVTVTFPDGTTDEVVAGDNGRFEAISDGAQPSGEVSATATDTAGNASGATTQDYDVVTPAAPLLAIPANADGFINAEEEDAGLQANIILDDPAQAGEDVVVSVTDDEGTSAEATLTLTADDIEAGSVSLPLDFADLAEGALEASAKVGGRDANSLDITLDTTAPSVAVDPLTTNDTTPPLSGTVDDPEATVTVTVDGADVEATNNGDGTWRLADDTLSALPEGESDITVTATDAAGNETTATSSVTVDTIAPDAPTVDPTDGSELSGSAEPNSTVEIDVDGDGTPDHSVTADGDGNWLVTPDTPLDDGTEISATATDEAGNTSDPTTVTVDGTAPAAPVIIEATDDVGDITDPLASGDSTDDTTPTLIGTAEAESTIEVFQDGDSVGTATADADGNWSFTPTALDDGEVTFTATATDAAGNTSAASGAFTVTVDASAPDAPTLALASDTGTDGDGITSDGTVNVGNLEDGATWEYSTDGG
ncbi:Ig-like domain-containing protein, partial [Halomonas elongata]|uniref:Ig-like domain-containing protein n=1 Tax=Halomonas elongata TaxID=2746 RepID=UPI0023B00BD1